MTRGQWVITIAGLLLGAAGLLGWGVAESWTAEIGLGVAALYVAIAGFALAITEVRKTATVARATGNAVRRTLQGVAASRLSVTIVQLRQAVSELRDAGRFDDARGAERALTAWRHLATDADGLVSRRFGADHEVLPLLRRSTEAARDASRWLYEADDVTKDVTADALQAMDETADQLGPLLEALLPNIPEDDVG